MSKRVPKLLLSDILEAASKIKIYTKGFSYTNFIADSKTTDAVIRNFEIIGEATKSISKEIKDANPDIPWKDMAGMRDVVIHNYFYVDYEMAWRTMKEDIPILKKQIKKLKKKLKNV